jgi:hypothetical protein
MDAGTGEGMELPKTLGVRRKGKCSG